MTNPIPFDNSYAQLPDRFFTGQHPTPVVKPGLIRVNQALAEQLDIDVDWLTSTAGLEVLAGNAVPAGAEPIATVYAGHQFGSWNPQLGDGRAVLLGEVVDTQGRVLIFSSRAQGLRPILAAVMAGHRWAQYCGSILCRKPCLR